MGATAVVDSSREDPVEAVRKITGGTLADIVIEAVGHEDQALDVCIDLCAKYGRILSFGVPPETIDALRWKDLFYKNITVHTSVDPDFTRDFPLAMRWIGEGRIDLSALVTHRFPLAKIQTAFDTFPRSQGRCAESAGRVPARSLKVLARITPLPSGEGRVRGEALTTKRIATQRVGRALDKR